MNFSFWAFAMRQLPLFVVHGYSEEKATIGDHSRALCGGGWEAFITNKGHLEQKKAATKCKTIKHPDDVFHCASERQRAQPAALPVLLFSLLHLCTESWDAAAGFDWWTLMCSGIGRESHRTSCGHDTHPAYGASWLTKGWTVSVLYHTTALTTCTIWYHKLTYRTSIHPCTWTPHIHCV